MNDFNLRIPMHGKAESRVTADNIAIRFGSGSIDTLGTPAMVGLMEKAAVNAVDKNLPAGYATVGMDLSIKHTSPTPEGLKVTAIAELTEVNGKKLIFKVSAFDEIEKIGEGIHKRYIVEIDRFRKNANKKIIIQ
jgi:fluoroacetyl-CoA thioesterase